MKRWEMRMKWRINGLMRTSEEIIDAFLHQKGVTEVSKSFEKFRKVAKGLGNPPQVTNGFIDFQKMKRQLNWHWERWNRFTWTTLECPKTMIGAVDASCRVTYHRWLPSQFGFSNSFVSQFFLPWISHLQRDRFTHILTVSITTISTTPLYH